MGNRNKKLSRIKDPDVPPSDETEPIRLSFSEFRKDDNEFLPTLVKNKGYIEKFSDKFKHICSLTRSKLPTETDEHSHALDWEKVKRKPKNYSEIVNPQIEKGYRWWQFSITQGANQTGHGRVIGFFKGNTFYLVWFDPKYELFPRR